MLSASPGAEYFFFDMLEYEALQNVVRSVCRAQKHPANPVMLQGDATEWDSAQASPWPVRTVLYDEEERLFKMWYGGTDPIPDHGTMMGYAISHDGVVWEKPVLGIYEFEGSTRNNIIQREPYGAIIKDLAEPDPDRRYKMATTGGMRYSPDGIRWTERLRIKMELPGPKAWDAVAFVRDDQDPDPNRRFKYVWQYYDAPNKPGPDQVRFKGIAYAAQETEWTANARNPMLSPNEGFEHENHFLMLIPYKGHYLTLYECGWYQPNGIGRFGAYSADIRLAHSRDCEKFQRINPEQVSIARGGANEWDGQFLVIADKLVVKDDTMYLYYAGQGSDWVSWPPGNALPNDRLRPPGQEKPKTGAIRLSRTGLATMRLDGFTCVHVPDYEAFGSLTTKPLQLDPAARLTVNMGDPLAWRSWLQVEMLDAGTGEPLPGFAHDDCPRLLTDGVRVPVHWASKEVGAAGARAIRLRFHLYGGAKLYSFRFA